MEPTPEQAKVALEFVKAITGNKNVSNKEYFKIFEQCLYMVKGGGHKDLTD